MKKAFALILKAWRGFCEFSGLSKEIRSIVFYAEDSSSWVHFEPIIHELAQTHHQSICYLTSSPEDPVLTNRQENIKTFYIGSGGIRTILFLLLKVDVMIMTMPDLETFHIKRSRSKPVHYIFVHHSICSTHVIYRRDAYNHFDTIFCVGPYQVQETRSAEALFGLKAKTLLEHGCGCLDTLLSQNRNPHPGRNPYEPLKILIAPSWGKKALLEICGNDLVELLLNAGYQVVVRPHSLTTKMRPDVVFGLSRKFSKEPNFTLETDISSKQSLKESDVMISDWSGVAFEYAFSRESPVIFIEVPRKVNNPEYKKLGLEAFEVYIRSKIGVVVSPDRLKEIPKYIEQFCSNPQRYQEQIRKVRSDQIFNIGKSGAVGAEYIMQIAKNCQTQMKRSS